MPMRGMGGARQHYVGYDFKENVLAQLDEYLYETGVHIEKNKLGNTWWQKQAHVSYARMCVMGTYASV